MVMAPFGPPVGVPGGPTPRWRLALAGAEAAEIMALLWVQATAWRRGEPVPDDVPGDLVERLSERLSRPGAVGVVVVLGPEIVACCQVEPAVWPDGSASATTAHLSGLAVRPDQWSRGMGRAVLDQAMAQLRQSGFTAVQLWVLEANSRARALYERAGWVVLRTGAEHPEGPHAVYVRDLADPVGGPTW